MEETAPLPYCTGEIFSFDVVAVVLSRGAVDTLATACSPPGFYRSSASSPAAGVLSTNSDAVPEVCGRLSGPSRPVGRFPRASLALGRRIRASGSTGGHTGATRTDELGYATTIDASRATRSRSGLPRSNATLAAISEFPVPAKESPSCAGFAHGCDTGTHRESCGSGSLRSSAGRFVEGFINDSHASADVQDVYNGEYTSVLQPYADSGERELLDRRRNSLRFHGVRDGGKTGCGDTEALSAVASFSRPGTPQAGNGDINQTSEEWHTNQRRRGSHRKDRGAGSTPTTVCSSQLRSANPASDKDVKATLTAEYEANDEEDSRKHCCRIPCPLEEVHKFVAAALRASRSSLYVCLPIHATEALSLDSRYAPPSTVTSVPECAGSGSTEARCKETGGAESSLQTPSTSCVAHRDGAAREQWSGDASEADRACSPAFPGTGSNDNFSDAFPLRRAPSGTASTAAACDACAVATAAAPVAASARAAAASSVPASPAASAATPAACVASVPFTSRAAVSPVVSRWYDSGQDRAKRSSTATPHAHGFYCTYAQLDTHQVVTPSCCVFRIVHHLYAFLTTCGAGFAPFTADVYVVPVWVDAAPGSTRAAHSSAAASTATETGSEGSTGETTPADASVWSDDPAAGAALSSAAVEAGSAVAGEQGVAEGSSLVGAPAAAMAPATASSAESPAATETAYGEGDNYCEWQRRLLKALQRHCWSCRGLHVTGGDIINVVDLSFKVTDRSFAVFSWAAGEFATRSYALEMGTLHAYRLQRFSKVLSTLRIPPAPSAVAEGSTRGTAPAAEIHAAEADGPEGESPAGGHLDRMGAAADPEERSHPLARTAVCDAAEGKWPGTAAAKSAEADAAKAVAVEAADGEAASHGAVAVNIAAESEGAAAEDTTGDGAAAVAEQRTREPTGRRRAGAVCQFQHVIVAGTFDRLHAGHKLLLTVAALVCSERLGIGLTAGALVQKKTIGDAADAAAAVQPFAVRAHAATAFVALIISAARATSYFAADSNKSYRMPSSGPRVAPSAEKQWAAYSPGRDGAVPAAAEFSVACSRATPVFSEEIETSQGNAADEEVENSEGARTPEAEDKRSVAPTVRAAEGARDAASGGKEPFMTLRAPGGQQGGDVPALRRNSSSESVHFVNYCQTVLHNELYKRADTQSDSSVRCACAKRLDADFVSQRYPCRVAAQRKGRARMSAGTVEVRGAEQKFSCAGEGRQETTGRLGSDTGCDEGNIVEKDEGREREKGAKTQVVRHLPDEDGGLWTRDMTVEVSKISDAGVGVQEQTAWEECRNGRTLSLMPSQEQTERHTSAAEGNEEVPDTDEQLEKGAVDVEGCEKQWTKLVCEVVTGTETLAAPSDAAADLNTRRINNTSTTSPQRKICRVQSRKSTCIRSGAQFLRTTCGRVFLPWTSSVVPPNFFPDPSPVACERLAARAVPTDITPGAVENLGGDSAVLSGATGALSGAALPHLTLVESASVALSASPEVAASSISSVTASATSAAFSAFRFGREPSVSVPTSRLPGPRTCTAASGAAAAVAGLGTQCRKNDVPCSRTSASSERAGPHCVACVGLKCYRASLNVYLASIEDRLGPAGDLAFDALIVSSESLAGGFYVNEERIKRSHPPVWLVNVPALSVSNHCFLPQAPAATVLADSATLPPSGPAAKNSAQFLPASGHSPPRARQAPAPRRWSPTSSAEERDAPACDLGSSHVARNHTGKHTSTSADSVRERNSTTSSLIPGESLNDQLAPSVSCITSNSGAVQGTGASELDPLTTEELVHSVPGAWLGKTIPAEECTLNVNEKGQEASGAPAYVAREAHACGASRSGHVKTTADMVDKVSSSELRQQQATALQSKVNIAALRHDFVAAAELLVQPPTPVWRAYWSLLCSLYAAPWRRLFTLERLARLLSRIGTVTQRVPGPSCWDGTCDAAVLLSLYFAYAVHPPPGLCSCPVSPAHCQPATASPMLLAGDQCPEETRAGSSGTWAWNKGARSRTSSVKLASESVANEAQETDNGNITRERDALASAAEHFTYDDALVANEELIQEFIRDAAVCSRLCAYCRNADVARRPPVFDSSKQSSISEHVARIRKDIPQIGVGGACLQGDPQSAESPPCEGNRRFLRVLVSCVRTARESCGFLLPRCPLSPLCSQEAKSLACNCSRREESRPTRVRGKLANPGTSACRRRSCLQNCGGDVELSAAERADKMRPDLQPLESECCHVVRMLEYLELALPEGMYDVCARRMREEYYHLCDHRYARYRSQQLKTLQLRLSKGFHDLTEAEVALVKRNLLREQRALGAHCSVRRRV